MINAIIFRESIIIQKQLTAYNTSSFIPKYFLLQFELFKMLIQHVFYIQHGVQTGPTCYIQHLFKMLAQDVCASNIIQHRVQHVHPTCWNRLTGP